ncbi:MAG TPA: peptidylprolyl isomerase [Candidatus Paceibacterota bacterium]
MKTFIIILALIAIGAGAYYYKKGSAVMPTQGNPRVVIVTNQGEIELELYADKAPQTVKNFLTLAGKGFYNDTLFHRVIKGFMIQGGDPNTRAGDPRTFGTGGPGYQFADEIVEGLSNITGAVSMANSGPNTNGSQFFINVVDNTYLDGKYTVFGRVLDGMDIAIKISNMPVNANNLPLEPVRIDEVLVRN